MGCLLGYGQLLGQKWQFIIFKIYLFKMVESVNSDSELREIQQLIIIIFYKRKSTEVYFQAINCDCTYFL